MVCRYPNNKWQIIHVVNSLYMLRTLTNIAARPKWFRINAGLSSSKNSSIWLNKKMPNATRSNGRKLPLNFAEAGTQERKKGTVEKAKIENPIFLIIIVINRIDWSKIEIISVQSVFSFHYSNSVFGSSLCCNETNMKFLLFESHRAYVWCASTVHSFVFHEFHMHKADGKNKYNSSSEAKRSSMNSIAPFGCHKVIWFIISSFCCLMAHFFILYIYIPSRWGLSCTRKNTVFFIKMIGIPVFFESIFSST